MATRSTVAAEIERIGSLGLGALRSEWVRMFGTLPPSGLGKGMIGRIIAYRLQEQAFGGLDREARRHLDALTPGDGRAEAAPVRRLKPGTVLIREYQGERHTVTVVPGGYVWHATKYSSLSTIARAITGTAWNGPRFFGLRLLASGSGRDDGRPGLARDTGTRAPPARRRLADPRGG
jgi:hypothetical protein